MSARIFMGVTVTEPTGRGKKVEPMGGGVLAATQHGPLRKLLMSVDADTVRKIARLARIGIADEQVAPLAGELSTILGWIEQLGEVDTTGVAPMTAVIPNHLAWRTDAVTDGGIRSKVLANAPDATSGFFAVPKVIE